MSTFNINEVKTKLIDLFLNVKLRKTIDVCYVYYIVTNIIQIKHLNDDIINKERLKFDNLSLIDIVNYIYNSIDILIDIKAQEKVDQHFKEKKEMKKYLSKVDEMSIYEPLLIKTEKEVRNHIKV